MDSFTFAQIMLAYMFVPLYVSVIVSLNMVS